MNTVILFGIIGLICGVVLVCVKRFSLWQMFTIAFGLGLVGSFIGVFVAVAYSLTVPTEPYVHKETPLYALKNSNGITGAFIFASGNIEETTYYHYYYESDGGYREGVVTSDDNPLFIEEDRTDGAIIEISYRCVESDARSAWALCGGSSTSYHIPKGSLVREIKIE